MIKILPLIGTKSLRALNAFNVLLLGLKMLPAYLAEDYETFYASFAGKTEAEKEKLLREAVVFVPLAEDELAALVCFATDKNGVPYTAVNIKNLTMEALFEVVVAVCMEIGRIKIDLISEEEKKKFPSSQSIHEEHS